LLIRLAYLIIRKNMSQKSPVCVYNRTLLPG